MNKEYLEEQAAKEAAAAAALKDMGDVSDDVLAAKKLAAAAAAALAKSREKRRQKRALEAKNAGPPTTAAEATRQMLTRKGLSSKINYDVLDKLFDETLPASTKRSRSESDDKGNASEQEANKEENEAEETPKGTKDYQGGGEDDFTEGNVNEDYDHYNGEEMLQYDYEEDNWEDY